jgi:nucleotide-binding universal stress UspA family protein
VARIACLAAAAVACLAACHRPDAGRDAVLWSLPDPSGDDHGDGDLRYPGSADLQPGDLDLLELRARRAPGGTLFEAVFARSIRKTDGRLVSPTGQTLEQAARLGFFTFNIDVYVDIDRLPGSGHTDTLPGRKARIDPGFAWERAICLTPRPNEASALLRALWKQAAERESAERKEVLDEAAERLEEARVEAEAAKVFFPTRVRVLGNRVEFFVPEDALLGTAEAGYGYAVLVTGADIAVRFDLSALVGRTPAVSSLFALPLVPGYSLEAFGGGHRNDPLQPPVVDLVAPPGTSQEALLKRPPGPGQPYLLPGVVPAQLPAR